MKTKITEIYEVCDPCGRTANYLTCMNRFGRPPIKAKFDLSTYHKANCHVCGVETDVTEPRDFFYPDFGLLEKALNKVKVKNGN